MMKGRAQISGKNKREVGYVVVLCQNDHVAPKIIFSYVTANDIVTS